jgi:peptidoglycan/LPS O-acetylase OafA/YrhL
VPAPHAAGSRPARLGALDALRFVAALSVVAFHFTGINPAWEGPAPSDLSGLSRWGAYGAMGVPLFFVVSGFVVLMTAWGRDVPHFVASRIGRLFPAYWAAVVLAMLFAFVIWPAGSVIDGHAPAKADALMNLTMLQGAGNVQDLDGAFWTLWTEARFYALVAVLIVVGMTRRRVLAFAALWPIVASLAGTSKIELLQTALISDYAPYFAGGMLLYVIHRDGHDLLTWLLVGMQSLFALRFALGEYPLALTRATGRPVSTTLIVLISFACFGLVALVTLTRLNRRSTRWMTFLGALTYPLYLLHQKIGLFVIHVLRGEVSPWLAIGAALAVATASAAALHLLVEKPYGPRLRTAVHHALQRATREPDGTAAPVPAVALSPQMPPPPGAHTTTRHVAAPHRNRDSRVPIPAAARE